MLRSIGKKRFDIPQIYEKQTIGITSVLHLTADQDANEWHKPLAGVNHANVWQQNCNIRSLSTVIVLRMTGSSRPGNEMFPREAARPVRTSDLEDCYWHVCSQVHILLVLCRFCYLSIYPFLVLKITTDAAKVIQNVADVFSNRSEDREQGLSCLCFPAFSLRSLGNLCAWGLDCLLPNSWLHFSRGLVEFSFLLEF